MNKFLSFLLFLNITNLLLASAPAKDTGMQLKDLVTISESVHDLNIIMVSTILNLSAKLDKEAVYEKELKAAQNKSSVEKHELYYQWLSALSDELGKIQNKQPGAILFDALVYQISAARRVSGKSCVIS